MQKFLYAILTFVFTIFVGLGAYYFFYARNVQPSGVSQNQAGNNEVGTRIEAEIAKDCVERPVYTGASADTTNILKLFKGIGADVIYDASQSALISPSRTDFTVQYLKPGADKSCSYVWSGLSGGDGKVAYETKEGDIKIVSVTGFVLSPPAIAP